jgi:hypothetical protein
MAVVTHLAGSPGRASGEPVRVEVAGEALAFRRGAAPMGWSHSVPLAAVAMLDRAPTGAGRG